MAIYSLAQRTTQTVAGNPAADLLVPSGGPNTRVLEFGFTQNATTAGVYGVSRPNNDGSQAQTGGVAGLAEDGGNTATGKTTGAVAWGTAPTTPTQFNRRCSMPASIGAGVTFTFPRGFICVATKGMVFWIIATAPVVDEWWVVDE